MRNTAVVLLEVLGLVCIVIGFAVAWSPLGWLAAGLALLLVAWRQAR